MHTYTYRFMQYILDTYNTHTLNSQVMYIIYLIFFDKMDLMEYIHTYTCIYHHTHTNTRKYIHIYSNTYNRCMLLAMPRDMPRAMPWECM